ncbi:MAG: response regulator receiver and domain protein [Pseudonocardiales bacterium]|nr:response regulator receiver and domain protein [Pseudonocardiales bacterium]
MGPDPLQDQSKLLADVVGLGTTVAPTAIGCSLTERQGAVYRTPAFSGQVAWDLDQAQYGAGSGPCVNAVEHGGQQRWTGSSDVGGIGFAQAAALRGVRSVLSTPVPGQAKALNFYGSEVETFEAVRTQALTSLLGRCISALSSGSRREKIGVQAMGMGDEARAAAARGNVVSQAEELLRVRLGITRHAAFLWLVDRSAREHRPLVDIARGVIVAEGHAETAAGD